MGVRKTIVEWMRKQLSDSGKAGFVVGVSGGVDSAVVLKLAVEAAGGSGVLAGIMPCDSDPEDAKIALAWCRELAANYFVQDLAPAYKEIKLPVYTVAHPAHAANIRTANANTKARLRMIVLYQLANVNNYLVAGTGNKSELEVGYFTKYGDGGVDILPIGDLLKSQVYELAQELGVPDEIVNRPPSAGLWDGQTDEAEMGFTYPQLDAYLSGTELLDKDTASRIEAMRAAAKHKLATPPICKIGD